jgi:hypothetical protein
MANQKNRHEELDTPTTILAMICGCSILALNMWVFLQVY